MIVIGPTPPGTVARRARAGRDGGVERVDVDRDVIARTFGNQGEDTFGPELAALADRADLRAAAPRVLIALARRRGDVADSELRQAGDVALPGRPAHRVAVALAHAVPNINEIQMRIDLDQVDGRLVGEGADAGDVDRMVAAQHQRQCTARQDLPDGQLGVAMARGFAGLWRVQAAMNQPALGLQKLLSLWRGRHFRLRSARSHRSIASRTTSPRLRSPRQAGP